MKIKTDPTTIKLYANECSCCFLVWEDDELCDLCPFCKEHFVGCEKDVEYDARRLDRILEVMYKANLYHIPKVLSLMMKVLREKK